jgi:hypothetical protein
MLIFAALLCLAGIAAFCGAAWTARQSRADEGRMAGYIASLKAVSAEHRARIAELEHTLANRDQTLAAQDRLLDGQAVHLRSLDPRYVG